MAKLIEYLPPIMRQFTEMQQIMEVGDKELENINDVSDKVFSNAFIESCDEDGIKRFENPFGIAPDASERLEARKMRVYALWNSSLPYTLRGLYRQLDTMCGEGNYIVAGNLEDYELNICTHLTVPADVESAIATIEKMVPENMVISFSNQIQNNISGTIYDGGTVVKNIVHTITCGKE